jgi:predicted unusual protein kinase regulating ubiquinone biosynthesis (AarF/ABC1/UbiB family)
MMIERAQGSTMKQYISMLRQNVSNRLFEPLDAGPKMAQCLHNLAAKWFDEAMFGSGFYHGDLHSGNIMFKSDVGKSGLLTMIDFGNAKTLSMDERKAIFKMMVATQARDPGVFVENFKKILSPESQLTFGAKQVEFQQKVTEILSDSAKGPGEKIGAILGAANQLGLEIPGPIANFSRSELMLEEALNEVNQINKSNFEAALRAYRDAQENVNLYQGLGAALLDQKLKNDPAFKQSWEKWSQILEKGEPVAPRPLTVFDAIASVINERVNLWVLLDIGSGPGIGPGLIWKQLTG